MDRKNIGQFGEQLATDYLARNGYEIIDRNFGTRFGEIDIIVREKETIVFVEVKTRSGNRFGTPEEAITRDKQEKLRLMADYFLLKNHLTSKDRRIDSIGVEVDKLTRKAKIKHIKNAVGGL